MNRQRTGRGGRRVLWGALLGACVGLTGCFHEDIPGMNDDGDEPPPGTSTGVMPGSDGEESPDTGELPPDEGTSTGLVDPTTGGESVDESTGDTGDTGEQEGGSTSTGEAEDETTGGTALSVEVLVPGDLVITEIMWNPHCGQDNCEWIEILNATDSTVNLLDLYVQDGDYNAGNQGRVTTDVIVAPGDVAVIARGVSSWNYDFTPDAVYGPNPGLNNGSPDRAVILNSTEILDDTALFFDGEEGVAWSLSGDYLDAQSNDTSNFWCDAVTPLTTTTTTEYGSPGMLNPPC